MALQVRTCCFCVSLKTGSLIIGILLLIGCILEVLYAIGALVSITGHGQHAQGQGSHALEIAQVVLYLIVFLIGLVIQVLLILGVTQGRHNYVRWWILCSKIYVVILIILFILGLVAGAWSAAVSILIGILIWVYFIIVVMSYLNEATGQA